jgi:hypothetical protein
MLVDFLFQDIIAAPTADEYKVELERLRSRTSTVAADTGGVIDNSIPIARNNIAPLTSEQKTSSIWKIFSMMESPPDMSTMQVSAGVTEAHGTTSKALKDVFNKTMPESESPSSRITNNHMSRWHMSDRNDESSLYDAVERGELDDSPSIYSLSIKLHE